MNGKISAIVIAFLLGVIGYQSGVLDSFLHKGVKCGSNEALNLAEEIAIEKLLKPAFDNMNGTIEYNIDKINFNTIITKTYNKDTGYHECSAKSEIIGTFKFPKAKKNYNPKTFFGLILGSDDVISLGNDKYTIISPVWYSTEITDNKDQLYMKLKFDGDRTKFLKY